MQNDILCGCWSRKRGSPTKEKSTMIRIWSQKSTKWVPTNFVPLLDNSTRLSFVGEVAIPTQLVV